MSALGVPYDRGGLRVGIVHLGPGAFHHSHQAAYLDDLLRRDEGRDWAIADVGLLAGDRAPQAALRGQDCLYTLTTKAPDGTWDQQVIGSVVETLHGPDDPEAVLRRLAEPATRLVTLTITEGGYSADPETGDLVADTDEVAADLAHPDEPPRSALGYLRDGLRRRRDDGVAPFTVLSCDNIQGNGELLHRILVAFVGRTDADLATWIEQEVAFPSSMVDRITPATSEADRAALPALTGVTDACPVVAEPFRQWVVEDRFPAGRPALEAVGVQLVPDVAPYEQMKLRMLNASHQAVAHLGLLCGHTYVHEAVADPRIRAHLAAFLAEDAQPTVPDVPGVDLDDYAATLVERYGNEALADPLERICAYATDRLQAFLLPVVRDRLADGGVPHRSLVTVAAWAAGCVAAREGRRTLVDNRRESVLANAGDDPWVLVRAVGVFGDLADEPRFVAGIRAAAVALREHGPAAALDLWNGASALG